MSARSGCTGTGDGTGDGTPRQPPTACAIPAICPLGHEGRTTPRLPSRAPSTYAARPHERETLMATSDPNYPAARKVENMLRSARQKHLLGIYTDAIPVFRNVLAIDADNTDAYLGLAQVYLAQDELDKAQSALANCEKRGLDTPEFHFACAVMHRKNGAQQRERTRLLRCLEHDPDYIEAHQALSKLFFPGTGYIKVLKHLHQALGTRKYVEIGVAGGLSLDAAQGAEEIIGVDPAPSPNGRRPDSATVYSLTSDAYFDGVEAGSIAQSPEGYDVGFIDGLHTADQVQRDFLNMARYAKPGSVILFHDVLPLNDAVATRERETLFWAGDTWRFFDLLVETLPADALFMLPAGPTGLGGMFAEALRPDRLEALSEDVYARETIGIAAYFQKVRQLGILKTNLKDGIAHVVARAGRQPVAEAAGDKG